MSRGFASSYRIVLLATGLFVCFGALGARLVWLHVVDRDDWLETITRTRHQLIVETARRGDILDRRGAILATSRSLIVLGVDPTMVRPQDEAQIPRLATLIGVPEAEVRKRFTTRYRELPPVPAPAPTASVVFDPNRTPRPASGAADSGFDAAEAADAQDDTRAAGRERPLIRWAKLRDDVSEELYRQIEELGLRCLTADRAYRRAYPNNELAAHIVGFVDREQRPVSGVEHFADFYLRGQQGWRVGERDGRNRELAQFRTRDVPRNDGYSVTLSIESTVQDIVEQELARIAEQFQPLKATIIVSDPRTGFILGMGNYPTFNLNEYNLVPRDEQRRMRNIAVADIYEPGSVFKIVAAAGAIEEGLVGPTTRLNWSEEWVEYRGRKLKLPREDHRFERDDVTVAEIIAHSSNRGAAHLGMLLGEQRLHRYARAFGFGEPLGFPVGGEVGGILLPPQKWNPLDITRIPMGHTIAATALQMHQAMAVIASGGVLWRPQIVERIRDASGETIFLRKDGIEIGRAVSERTAQTMAAMLMEVASRRGTAIEAAIEGFDVAGKTGTTIKIVDGRYDSRHHVASFSGFFPATRPQVAITVIVDDANVRTPSGVAYGRIVAAPSFKRIGEQLIPILDIKPNRTAARTYVLASRDGGQR